MIGVVQAVVGLDNQHLGDAGGSSGDPTNSKPLSVPTACGFYNFPNTGASDQTIGVIAPSDPVGTPNQRVSGYSSNDILNDYFPNLSNSSYRIKPTLNDVSLTVGTNTYSNGGSGVTSRRRFRRTFPRPRPSPKGQPSTSISPSLPNKGWSFA